MPNLLELSMYIWFAEHNNFYTVIINKLLITMLQRKSMFHLVCEGK